MEGGRILIYLVRVTIPESKEVRTGGAYTTLRAATKRIDDLQKNPEYRFFVYSVQILRLNDDMDLE